MKKLKFALKFLTNEIPIVFDDLEFGKMHYADGWDMIDSTFIFADESQMEELMNVYNNLFINDSEGGADAYLIREGGMTVFGRVFIYPTQGLNAKIHISVKN